MRLHAYHGHRAQASHVDLPGTIGWYGSGQTASAGLAGAGWQKGKRRGGEIGSEGGRCTQDLERRWERNGLPIIAKPCQRPTESGLLDSMAYPTSDASSSLLGLND